MHKNRPWNLCILPFFKKNQFFFEKPIDKKMILCYSVFAIKSCTKQTKNRPRYTRARKI